MYVYNKSTTGVWSLGQLCDYKYCQYQRYTKCNGNYSTPKI